MKSVLIADDHELTRLGLRHTLSGLQIYEAGDADAAYKLAKRHKPDLIVLAVRMPGDGLTALNRIRLDLASIPVVMLTAHDNPTYVARSVALGAAGFLHKSQPAKEIGKLLRAAMDGETLWTPEQLRKCNGSLMLRSNGKVVDLTKRESEVLKQMAFGLTNKDIASALGISYETVKEHVQHILRKIGVSDRTQAAVYAVKHQLA